MSGMSVAIPMVGVPSRARVSPAPPPGELYQTVWLVCSRPNVPHGTRRPAPLAVSGGPVRRPVVITFSDWRWSSPGPNCRAQAGRAHRLGAVPSQVMGQGLGDVPVVPELRFALRRTRPRIPGCAARGGATDPGLPLWRSFFHRQMSGCPASAGVGDCLHESTPPSRSGRACKSFFPVGSLQKVAHRPGIAHPQAGLTPTRRTTPDQAGALITPRQPPGAGQPFCTQARVSQPARVSRLRGIHRKGDGDEGVRGWRQRRDGTAARAAPGG